MDQLVIFGLALKSGARIRHFTIPKSMDTKKVKRLLDKVTRLFNTLESQQGDPDPIERDLMLSYLRQLYGEFLPAAPKARPEVKKPEPNPGPKAEPRVIEIAEQAPPPSPPRDPEPTPTPTPPPPPPPKNPSPEPSSSAPTSSPRKDMHTFDPLFKWEEAKDLSAKLSTSPVSDLQYVFAINDRLLFTNELFAKDNQAFQQALNLLNRYTHFEEAKVYICEIADQYQWLKKDRVETAKDFVKTVRRRYLS